MDRRAPRARPRAPRLLWLRNRLPVLRRSGARAGPRRARSRRRSPRPPMNDLRARIAQIVERDRARIANGERGISGGTVRNPFNGAVSPTPWAGDPSAPRAPLVRATLPTFVHELPSGA